MRGDGKLSTALMKKVKIFRLSKPKHLFIGGQYRLQTYSGDDFPLTKFSRCGVIESK